MNDSNYPAYGVQIHLYDDEHGGDPIRYYAPPDIAAHAVISDTNQPWSQNDRVQHSLTAEIRTRAGVVREEILVHPVGDNAWIKACRVLDKDDRTLEEDVDSSWPRERNGRPDWGYISGARISALSCPV